MSPDVAAVNQASMAIEAAVDGQGIALARTALAALDVLAGRLIPPFDLRLPASYAYYIVCPPAFPSGPKSEPCGIGCWPRRAMMPHGLKSCAEAK